jgi:transcriptional regulator with XRE-family HTH domain
MATLRRHAETFGQTLRGIRLKQGLTQVTVAKRTDSSRVYIGELERGLKVPTLTMILKLAVALECKVWDLVSVFDEAPRESFLENAPREKRRRVFSTR